MVEWQTRMSQKHLSERTCGFESRFRHPKVCRYHDRGRFASDLTTNQPRSWKEQLDRLGVAWRFSKPTTISVARREAVARLDEFVGPKY